MTALGSAVGDLGQAKTRIALTHDFVSGGKVKSILISSSAIGQVSKGHEADS